VRVALLLIAFSTVCAIVPMLLFLGVVWWMDRYDREPIWLVSLTFLWGAIGSIILAVIGSTIVLLPVQLIAPGAADATGAVVVAPLIEEPAKAMILLLIIWSRHFDNMTDGFVYGAAAGLGFGMTENFLYFAGAAVEGDMFTWIMTVVVRTLYSALMHASATAVVGAALGFARFRGCLMLVVSGVLGLGLAMGIHALWNGLLTLDTLGGFGGALFGMNLLLFPLEFLFILAVYQLCLFSESAMIRRELAEEAGQGLMPEEHARIMGSYLARNRRKWVPQGLNRRAYVRAATMLAFRKYQAEHARPGETPYYEKEVERLREEIRNLLAKAG
jgi:RsiW-degrading membrane proteinase PrsW (M82 family)